MIRINSFYTHVTNTMDIFNHIPGYCSIQKYLHVCGDKLHINGQTSLKLIVESYMLHVSMEEIELFKDPLMLNNLVKK